MFPESAKNFNPFLSEQSVARLHDGAMRWLQLCVLEGRLQRINQLFGFKNAGQKALLIRELEVYRPWDVKQHPEWLVFEVEGHLQIRPAQYAIAKYLTNNPGAIVQLNMGEGKTRVIMPMLILHLAKARDSVIRLNILPALFEEVYGYLHNHLCSSVLGRKLFVQPFQREVELTKPVVIAMRSFLNYCQKEGGMLLVAPEHRLSLMLKRQELRQQGHTEVCKLLDRIAEMQYIDLLDESDELLHHRFQLIYAWPPRGRTNLPALESRARAVQALLQIISEHVGQHKGTLGAAIVKDNDIVVKVDSSKTPGAFYGFRLLPGSTLTSSLPRLKVELAEALFEAPPYEMRWMKGHALKDKLIPVMTDPLIDADAAFKQCTESVLTEKETCDVLAVRGLLACDMLSYWLQARHRVDYGVSRLKTAKKRLAVPFRASDTPSERSEFAQPDTALLATTLSYYYDGLSKKELLDALKVLLGLGLSAQSSYYNEWIAVAGVENVPETLNNVSKIDTSNTRQMDEMHELFLYNMAAINFWLNFCVFPREMQQYPQRLLSNAWHLADTSSGRVIGFSGTNDNGLVLPLQVRQHVLQEQGIHGTNGKMLDIILQNPEYSTLCPEDGEELWKAVLRSAMNKGLDALLDCGALLAGVNNRTAAEFVLDEILALPSHSNVQGICYFDTGDRCWNIMDRTRRRAPRGTSHISEQNCFTMYDEARCRGADLQLRQTAVALLTLGPRCCKDKLMQAAGRLRQLGRGQRIVFVGTKDISDKIAQACNLQENILSANGTISSASDNETATASITNGFISSKHVLQWVMSNTVHATLHAMQEWSRQGLYFANSKSKPDHAFLDELLDLSDMYGPSRRQQPVEDIVKALSQHVDSSNLPDTLAQMVKEIQQHSSKYGQGHLVVSQTGLNEEVERELEREQEQEAEIEREVARMDAQCESDWEYDQALGSASLQALQKQAQLMPLQDLARGLKPESVGNIPWSGNVFITANFYKSIAKYSDLSALNEYLRTVDTVLVLPCCFAPSTVVLLSEREANALLERMLLRETKGTSVSSSPKKRKQAVVESRDEYGILGSVLTHLCYICEREGDTPAASFDGWVPRLAIASSGNLKAVAGLKLTPQLVSAQLFNGETTYVDPKGRRWDEVQGTSCLQELQKLVTHRVGAAEALVRMRGKAPLFNRSQLELACGEV